MKQITRFSLLFVCVLLSAVNAFAQSGNQKIYPYRSNDGGIFWNITANGQWAVIRNGSESAGGTATPKLFEVATEKISEVSISGRVFDINAVSNDGNIVVGSLVGRPAAYNRSTGKTTLFSIPTYWTGGALNCVTPDGKWAAGAFQGYAGPLDGDPDVSNEFYFKPVLVNVETGQVVETPNVPTLDMSNSDQHQGTFTNISADGNYVLGKLSWSYPSVTVAFVYDVKNQSYSIIGFDEKKSSASNHDDIAVWTPKVPHLDHIDWSTMSPDGRYVTGQAYMSVPQEGSMFNKEYGAPYRYDVKAGTFEVLGDGDGNYEDFVIDDAGTIFANPNTGGPLRDFRILYKDKYWISLSQICQQKYGFNFSQRTGFDRTGTITSVSGDGSRFVSFADPTGESYFFDFGQPVEEICADIDLLDNYTVNPEPGSVFSQLSVVEINFGRTVNVLGSGKNVHLYKSDGSLVANGLSSGNSGLSLKTGSKSIVNAVFRTRNLEAGEKYYVAIDAGSICVGGDENLVNKEIRIAYTGRSNGPVKMVKSVPEDHSELRVLDAASSYIILTFDSPVKVVDEYEAYVERVEDHTRVATLTLSEGNTESTKNQVLLYPTSATYFYSGLEYKVVVESGSLCDYSKSTESHNERIELTLHGTYVRESGNDAVLFAEDFENPANSYSTWLRYEGDHRKPLAAMQQIGFDADNFPWYFQTADDESYSNIYATSHSLYSPSGKSDDWMMTPQIIMPEKDKVVLEFDAQSYYPSKKDHLKVYVFVEDHQIAYLNDAWMEDIRSAAQLLADIELSAGATQEKTEGEWTHYTYDLTPWAGKNIYVAFVNDNDNQSAVFLDNVLVQREQLYTFGFSNNDRVVAQSEITIAGQFTVKTADPVNSISLVLRNSAGTEVSRIDWPTITGSVKDRPLPFTFSKPLPLTIGAVNDYSIDVVMGEKVDTYKGTITDLTFKPTKHVVLEECTGIDCPNCPQGILVIEKCEKLFGEQFIPISIHTYTGDPYGTGMAGYSEFLGLSSAPSARINRIKGTYFPMINVADKIYDSYSDSPVWYDIIASELDKLSLAELGLQAVQSADGKQVNLKTTLRYALNAKSQSLSLLVVILEDGLVNYQANNLGARTDEILGPWANGGINSAPYAYPVTHNDVARSVVGQNYNGTLGLFPSSLEAGKEYTTELTAKFPEIISDVKNASAVAMLINTDTGEIINATKTRILDHTTSVDDIELEALPATAASIYSPSGMLIRQSATAADIQNLPAGVYIFRGKKYVVK